MLTGITEITRNASTASRGLKQISSRLTQTLDESSSTGQKLKDIYSGLGIALLDGEGQIRSTYDILADLAGVWNTLSTNQQEYIALTSAGSNQVQNFTALMSNFGHVVDATATAENSAGSAARENATYMESLEAKVQGLKAAWQELVTEGGTINKFIKLLLDAGTAVLKFADSDIGQLIIKVTALGLGFKYLLPLIGATGLWKPLLSGAVEATAVFGAFTSAEEAASFSTTTLSTAFKGLAGSLATLALPAVLIGFAALALHLEKIKDPAYQAEQTIDDLNNRIRETNDTISQLESTGADESVLEMYRKQAEELNKELEEAEANLFHIKNDNFRVASGATEDEDMGAGTGGYGINWQETNRVEQAISTYHEAADAVKGYEDAVLAGEDAEQDYLDALNEQAEARENLIDIYSEFKENEAKLEEDERQEYEQLKNLLDQLGYLKDSVPTTADEFSKLADEEGSVVDTTRAVINSLNEQDAEMHNNWDSVQDLIVAETQLTNGQKLSESQIQALIAKYPALRSQIDAMRQGTNAATQALHAQAQQSFNTSKTVIANSKAEAKQMVADAQAEVDAIYAKIQAYQLWEAEQHHLSSYEALRDAMDKYGTALGKALQTLRAAQAALNFYTQAEYYGTDATNTNTSATDSNNSAKDKAAEKERKLKEEISKTTDALKDQTEAIKNAADYMVDRIDEQIDKLEDSKDEINDYYDAWIDRLKETNEDLEEQIELEEALQALAEAKSKKVRVFKDGQYVYTSDTQAVAEAQKKVSTLQKKNEQEDLIKALEEARKRDLASVDKQIDAWEKEKKTWEDASKSYDDYLAKQTLGIDQEKNNWEKRLGEAKAYATDYLKLMQAVNALDNVDTSNATKAQKTIDKSKAVISSVTTHIKNLPDSTKNSLINKIDTKSPVSSYSPVEKVVKTDSSGNTVINVSNITLPNVSNPTEFIADLKDFARYASQSATSR